MKTEDHITTVFVAASKQLLLENSYIRNRIINLADIKRMDRNGYARTRVTLSMSRENHRHPKHFLISDEKLFATVQYAPGKDMFQWESVWLMVI